MSSFLQLDIAGAITSIALFAWFLFRYVVNPRSKLINAALKNQEKIGKIYEEMYPNGGGTLRDSLV